MAILQLRTARGWSLEQTARVFHLTAATISSWMKRLEEEGADALVQLPEPINRFPDYVRYVVQQLKLLCPALGKKKLAEKLARARFPSRSHHGRENPEGRSCADAPS